MSNLKLITTETFNNLPCNFCRNMNNDILLTREQIGQALEYSNPQKAIDNIHSKHRNRLDELSVTTKLRATDGKCYNTMLYTERGIMEICRWSRQKNANIFMDWTWDIIQKYRHNELTPDLSQITSILTSITNTLTTLTQTMTSMQQEINAIKETQSVQPKLPKKKWSYWSTKMYPKYQLLTDYFHITHKELYKNLYSELQNTYPDIDLNQEVDDYCCENDLESAYTLDVIEHNITLRKLFELIDNFWKRIYQIHITLILESKQYLMKHHSISHLLLLA